MLGKMRGQVRGRLLSWFSILLTLQRCLAAVTRGSLSLMVADWRNGVMAAALPLIDALIAANSHYSSQMTRSIPARSLRVLFAPKTPKLFLSSVKPHAT